MATIGGATAINGPIVQADTLAKTKAHIEEMPITFTPDSVVEMLDFLSTDEYNTTNWTLTAVEAGAGSASVAVQTGTKNGVLLLTNDAADDDSINLQKKVEAYKLEAGKKVWFEANVKVSDADQCDFMIGLAITDTTALDASDRVGFRIADGNASILCKNAKNSTETSTDSGVDASDDTYVKLGFICDGVSTIKFFVDRVLVAQHTTNICDDEEMAITINLTNGEAVAKTATIDYVMVVKER